jgi:ribosome-associated protein
MSDVNSSGTMTANRLPAQVLQAVHAAQDKKAADVVVLDLREVAGFTDYFVVCSGQNARQVKAIADAVEEALARAASARPNHVEGYARAEWVLLDYFDFIVHIFNPETRLFYALERLWGSAERLPMPEPVAGADGRARS